jgi:pimeloyl-ACP methyl ester carboxylesterase
VADLYRSVPAEARVRDWCRSRLERWPQPHETTVLDTSLGATHLTTTGSGPATCLYLPGTNFNAATSTAVLSALGLSFRVVCADLPGQPGLSAAARPRDEVTAFRGWVNEVLDHVRTTGDDAALVLVGHSRGAAVALHADPGTVDGLLLLSPAGLVKVRLTPSLLGRSLAWLLRPTPRSTRRLVALMAGEPARAAGLDDAVEWLTLVARCTRTTGAPGPLPSRIVERWRERPVRVLSGERDVFFSPDRLAGPVRDLLGGEVVTVRGAGHLVVDQCPDVVVDHARGLC